MAKNIVTLYIDDTSLRLMVTDGNQIKEWAESPLEPGLIENTAVVKEAEFVAKVKQLFIARKVQTKRVIVGVSGLRCLTRPITLPQLPKEMLDEAVTREAKRVLPVPPEQLYISWQTTPTAEEKTEIFLVAIPHETADSLLKALHQAGLEPNFLDLKPLVLARVVKEATAVIVDVQTTEFDIIIMANGIPQPVRTIPFLNEALSWQEKLSIIRNELDRTITFYNSNNPENILDSSVPVFASGGLANESELCQTLSDEVGHPVLSLPSPLQCPEGFAPSRYMANIGLVLQRLSSGKDGGPSVINLNSLPTSYQLKPVSLTHIIPLPGAAVGIGLLVFLIMLIQSASADIATTRVQLNTTNQLLQQKQSQRQELSSNIAQLQKKITEMETSRDSHTAALGSLEKQSAGINRDLEVTIISLPNTIKLSSVNHNNNLLTISGWTPGERDVLQYIQKLDKSNRFGEISITNMTRIADEGMEFTLLGSLQTTSNVTSSIEVALNSLPTTITLTDVKSTDGTLAINGRSPDEDDAIAYLRVLEASGKFREITITSMTRNEDGGMDFSLVLKIGG